MDPAEFLLGVFQMTSWEEIAPGSSAFTTAAVVSGKRRQRSLLARVVMKWR
jgi:hypothetical protein